MPYTVEMYDQVKVEDNIVIYIGHGSVTKEMKIAVRKWASSRGIKRITLG